jgi:hypothetical protein
MQLMQRNVTRTLALWQWTLTCEDGSQILGHYCLELDDAKLMGNLRTDSEDKVRLYKRFGSRWSESRK